MLVCNTDFFWKMAKIGLYWIVVFFICGYRGQKIGQYFEKMWSVFGLYLVCNTDFFLNWLELSTLWTYLLMVIWFHSFILTRWLFLIVTSSKCSCHVMADGFSCPEKKGTKCPCRILHQECNDKCNCKDSCSNRKEVKHFLHTYAAS